MDRLLLLYVCFVLVFLFFFFKQKTAYEMRISDWSSDVCSSDLPIHESAVRQGLEQPVRYWVPSIATSGIMVYSGEMFPNWQGNIFMGGMNGNQSDRKSVV